MSAKRDLKAFVRLDSSGRVVPGSLIFRTRKPNIGRWMEIVADPCCGVATVYLYLENSSTETLSITQANGVAVTLAPDTAKILQVKTGALPVTVVGDGEVDWAGFDAAEAPVNNGTITDSGVIDQIGILSIDFTDPV